MNNFDELRAQVEEEVNDPAYSRFWHGRRTTYNQGCRKPLCRYKLRKDMRDWNERRTGSRPATTEQDFILEALQKMYENNLFLDKASAAS